MKKSLFISAIAILPFISCSSSEDEITSPTANNNKINPPAWIKGKWTSYMGGSAYQSFTFKDNDIVMTMGTYSQSYKYIADN